MDGMTKNPEKNFSFGKNQHESEGKFVRFLKYIFEIFLESGCEV